MISERQFANGFSSFWALLLPDSDRFVRKLNLSKERFDDEVSNVAPADRRGLINETAFLLSVRCFQQGLHSPQGLDDPFEELPDLISAAHRKILVLEGRAEEGIPELSEGERNEIVQIADSTLHFVSKIGWDRNDVVFQPRFLGCGFVAPCVGDLRSRDTLVEIKAGDRAFRSVDIRQLLVYASLEYASRDCLIPNLILLNPRKGTYCRTTMSQLSTGMGGESPESIVRQIINFACGLSLSR